MADTKSLSKVPAEMMVQVMNAMGGEEKWAELKYVSWTFFGARHLIWDKGKNRVRIDSPRDSSVYVLDMNTGQGKYWQGGKALNDPAKLQKKMAAAKSIWINDMYWLFMPFKLNDPGVKVMYVREDVGVENEICSVFSLTFDGVGETPENRYEIFVDHKEHLVKKWDYFAKASDNKANGTWAWDNYQAFNGLLLSGERSDKSGPSNIKVYDEMEDKTFSAIDCFKYY